MASCWKARRVISRMTDSEKTAVRVAARERPGMARGASGPCSGAKQLGLLGVELLLGDESLLQEFGELQQLVGD